MSDGLDWMDQGLASLPAKLAALAPSENVVLGLVEPPAVTAPAPTQQVEPGQPRPGEFVQSRRVVKPAPPQAEQPTEIAVEVSTEIAEASYAVHPDAYFPRVITYVRNDETYYELLKTGQAIPRKASPENRGFDFWITDTDYVANVGVYRQATGRRS